MSRVWGLTEAAGFCLLAFVAYKTVELGPYGAAILFGRCLHVLIAAAQGYL